MINRRIIASGLSIVSALAVMGGATFAFFSDTGTSSNNVFAAGSLDLQLSNDASTYSDSVTATFGGSNLAPGQCLSADALNLKNNGSVAADHAEVAVSNLVTDAGSNANPDMDSYLRFQVLNYDGGSEVSIPDSNVNGYRDIADLQASGGLDNLSLTDINTNHALNVQVCLDASAPSEIQGDQVDSTFTVTLNQDASQ